VRIKRAFLSLLCRVFGHARVWVGISEEQGVYGVRVRFGRVCGRCDSKVIWNSLKRRDETAP
jgi:hypothetical protein